MLRAPLELSFERSLASARSTRPLLALKHREDAAAQPAMDTSISAARIRLLTLGLDEVTGRPTYKLETFDKAATVREYIAISYCWEDETPNAEIRLENGGRLPISQTLACLLDALRTWYTKISVWIDALCINQADSAEKAT